MDRRFLVDWNYLADRFSSSLKVAMLHEDFSYFADRDIPANLSYGESDRLVAKYDITYFLNNDLFFRSGAEYEHAKGEGTSITNVSRDDFSAYALMHHQPLKSLLYNVSIRAGGSSAYSIPFIYSVDAKYLPHKNWSIRGAYSTNYRLPTFNDLYWEPGGNPDLKPEFSRSAELGLDYKHTFFTISGGWYVIHSEDLIQWRPVTSDFWQPQNISEASNKGIELMFDIQRNFGDHKLHLNASYDYTLASDKEIDKQLIYVPKNRAGANLDYRWHSWKINYNLQYVGKVFITTSNSQSLDDYLLSDMALSRSFFMNHMDASFRVNNVFNVSYQSVSYRPMPGRNFVFQLNFKL